MEKKRVCIIGGGASGMIAAIMASKEGSAVTLLEHNEKTGKKILATGNGRCNLTNLKQEPECYHSTKSEAVWETFQEFSLKDTLDFFTEIGVSTKDKNGYLYPASMQAASVQELLELEARYRKVKIKCKEHVKEILVNDKSSSEDARFYVVTETWKYPADAVILANGSSASEIEGADGSGYEIAKALGHKIIKPLPSLVPLKGKGKYFSKWAGTRIEGKLTLLADGQKVQTEEGEIQLTDYGISGIPVFQISSRAVRFLDEQVSVTAILDFMPDLEKTEVTAFLEDRQKQCPYKSVKELLIGLFPKKLIEVLAEGKPDIETVSKKIKEFPVIITGAKSEKQAQVCSGGVSLVDVNMKTMESRRIPGLYFAGEILDVDGICGGYNLQWAWSSGAVAGKNAAFDKTRENI